MARFKVCYTIKCVNKSESDYNVLLERKSEFDDLTDAIRFAKLLKVTHNGAYKLVGEPIIERKTKHVRSYN
jgi:hypothetical protein